MVVGVLVAGLAVALAPPLTAQPPTAEGGGGGRDVGSTANLRAFDTIADVRAARGLTRGEQIAVRGHRQAEDGGGGVFRYDPESKLPADGGAVLELTRTPGRLIRVVDPDDDCYAEWFGAYGDGDSAEPHADQEAINKCLAAYGRVKLRARTYGVCGTPTPYNANATYHAVDLGPYYRIIGSGRERTNIKLLDGTNPRGDSPANNYFSLFANRAFHESAEHVVISDLTIDCNFDGQNRETTINAISVRGGGALLERLNLRGYGTGRHPETGSSRECFVVNQGLVYKAATSCRRAAVLRDLDFTGCGHNGDLDGKVAEITHILVGGAHNFDNVGWILPQGNDPGFDAADDGENENNWWPSYGGLVENCVIHDEVYEPETQKSPLNGITYADCIGLTVRGNRVENFEGAAVFTMSWWNRDTTIVDNRFLGVTSGLTLLLQAADGKPIQCPRHEAVLFAHNEIVLGSHKHAPWGTCGVNLFGSDMPAVIRMNGLHIRENTIAGRAYTNAQGARVCPLGIKVQILRPTYHDLRFEDNVLDLPDYGEEPYIPQEPFSQSLLFFPLALWQDAAQAGHVVYRGNRNREGKPLYPILADWYFKNAPRWGKPAAR